MVPSKRDEVRGASKRDEVRGASKRDEVRGAKAAAMTSRKKSAAVNCRAGGAHYEKKIYHCLEKARACRKTIVLTF